MPTRRQLAPLPRRTPNSTPDAATPEARRAKLQEAADARDALAEALTRVGIQLPAMDVRTPWADAAPDRRTGTDETGGGEPVPAHARYALVNLGVCSAPVAFALAAVIANGAGR